MHRAPVIGEDGPVVVVTGRVAVRLRETLNRALAEAVAGGATIPDDVAEAIRAIDQVGREYASRKVGATSADGISQLPQLAESQPWRHGLSTAQVAEILGVTPRNVVDLRARGRLEGVRVGREWRFDPLQVQEFVEARAA